MSKYIEISESTLPRHVRWDTPPECQGQIVEVSYADARPGADLACAGARYKRVEDRSDRSVAYYRRP